MIYCKIKQPKGQNWFLLSPRGVRFTLKGMFDLLHWLKCFWLNHSHNSSSVCFSPATTGGSLQSEAICVQQPAPGTSSWPLPLWGSIQNRSIQRSSSSNTWLFHYLLLWLSIFPLSSLSSVNFAGLHDHLDVMSTAGWLIVLSYECSIFPSHRFPLKQLCTTQSQFNSKNPV